MFETGTATNISDLFSRLATFATTAGWTNDHSASDRLFLTRSGVSVAFRWSTTSPTCAGVYQHTAFVNSSTDPGNHTNDSGQGAISGTNATLLGGRHVQLVNSSMAYWFFESDVSGANYLHCVAEIAPLQYVHFGFGALQKLGTWTGGEYSYGQRVNVAITSSTDPDASWLLDGLATGAGTLPFLGVVHAESLPNQTASGKWGVCWAGGLSAGNDRAGVAREFFQGGYRAGPTQYLFNRFGGSAVSGLIPLCAIEVWYRNRSLARWHPLGLMRDVRSINMQFWEGGQEVTVGSDTWLVFPINQKSGSNGGWLGVGYKKVTA